MGVSEDGKVGRTRAILELRGFFFSFATRGARPDCRKEGGRGGTERALGVRLCFVNITVVSGQRAGEEKETSEHFDIPCEIPVGLEQSRGQ